VARSLSLRWGGAYWYEEDVDWAIAFYEHPEWNQRLIQLAGGSSMSKERIEETVRRWSPKYFEQGAEEKAKSNEPPHWNTLKTGDIVTLNSRPSEFVIEEGRSKLLGRDTTFGKIYRMPTNTFDQKVLKIVREGRTLWEKVK
jgi:hypothetical protein